MKKTWIGLVVITGLLGATSAALAQAQARAWCSSVRFYRGTEPFDFYSLDLTGIASGINGELFPTYESATAYASYLSLNDEWGLYDPIPGWMRLEVPLTADADENGWPDFFEVNQAVNTTSTGIFDFAGLSSGTVQAAWSRGAGSHTGTCTLDFRINAFQSLGVFTHTFEIIEYTGPLTYTPGKNEVTGHVLLQRTGMPENTLGGPVVFVKRPLQPHNELLLQAGTWTNEYSQSLTYTASEFLRDPYAPTNYYGYLDLTDGDLNTAEPDYYDWILSIDDPTDTDGDGVPDFSDDPEPSVVRRPHLTLQRTPGELRLTLSGDVGRLYHLLESTDLAAGVWTTNRSLTLTNDLQTIALPLPTGGPRFWQVVVP